VHESVVHRCWEERSSKGQRGQCQLLPKGRPCRCEEEDGRKVGLVACGVDKGTSLNERFNAALRVGKKEVSTNGGKHTSDAAMCKQNMIPFDGIVDECRKRDNTPLIIGALKSNQLSARVLSIGEAIVSEKSQGSWISLLGLSNVGKIEWEDMNVNRVV
jgi:hypothetical protein